MTRQQIEAETEARIIAWLREEAGRDAETLRGLHRRKMLTPKQTIEWETLIELKGGLASAIARGEHQTVPKYLQPKEPS